MKSMRYLNIALHKYLTLSCPTYLRMFCVVFSFRMSLTNYSYFRCILPLTRSRSFLSDAFTLTFMLCLLMLLMMSYYAEIRGSVIINKLVDVRSI
jgi:hypothetical protein